MIPETTAVPEAPDFFLSIAGLPLSNFVWIVFLLVFIGFIIYTAILLYHWFEYALDAPMMWPVMIVYFVVSVFLLLVLFFAALSIA